MVGEPGIPIFVFIAATYGEQIRATILIDVEKYRIHAFTSGIFIKCRGVPGNKSSILCLNHEGARLSLCPTDKEIFQAVFIYIGHRQLWPSRRLHVRDQVLD